MRRRRHLRARLHEGIPDQHQRDEQACAHESSHEWKEALAA
jgi:hypothetical protein